MHKAKRILGSLVGKKNKEISKVLPLEDMTVLVQPQETLEAPRKYMSQKASSTSKTSSVHSRSASVSTVHPSSESVNKVGQNEFGDSVSQDSSLNVTSKFHDIKNTEVFKIVEGAGFGGFGVVLKVQVSSEKERGRGDKVTTLAMKVLPKKRNDGKKRDPAKQKRKLLNEIQIMKVMGSSSPFVQCLHEAYETASNVFILSEYIGGGDAFSYFCRGVKLSEKQVRIILAELFLGLEYIHSKGYLHCDIKAENVMFDRKGHVKIVDFGLARELDVELPAGQQMCLEHVGSLPYMAPELLADFAGGRHTDWWAYGVLAFEFFTGCSPWHTMDDDSYGMTIEVCSRDVSLPRRSFSTAACALIDSLLTRDYRHRLGTFQDADIKKASFFKNIHWEKTAELKQLPAFLPPTKDVTPVERTRNVMKTFREFVASDVSENLDMFSQACSQPRSQAVTKDKEEEQGLSIGLKPMTVYFDSDNKCTYCISTTAAVSSPVPPMQFSDLIKPSDQIDRPTTRLFEGLLGSMDTSRSGFTTNTGSMTLDSSFTSSSNQAHDLNLLLMKKISSHGDDENTDTEWR